MIHGPCGVFNPKAPCMVDGKCSKKYPIFLKMKLTEDQKGMQSTEDGIKTTGEKNLLLKKRKTYKYR